MIPRSPAEQGGNAVETLYRAKAIRFESGERFPLLEHIATGLPVLDVIDYSLVYHRTISINSSRQRVAAIGLFLEWAEALNIDVNDRFGSGDLFAQREIESLAATLRQSKRKTITVDGQKLPAAILGETHGNRIDWVIAYLRWRTAEISQAMKASDPRVPVINARINQITEQLKNLKGRGAGKVRLGLTEEQQVRLFEIIKPGSPENPFYAKTQYRNYVLILSYFELGVRKAEPLTLKPQHLHLLDRKMPTMVIFPLPNDPLDVRQQPPLIKTAGRTLPLSPRLAQGYDTYILEHRSKVPNAKRNPFVFLDTAKGRAMSLASVYDIFVVLRESFPDVFPADFSPHVLRHTWNDRF